MLISSITLYSSWLDGVFNGKKKSILGNCKIYSSPIVTGMLCGFIVGARRICEIYTNIKDKGDNFSLAIALSSNAGIVFVVGTVGIKIWNNIGYGFYLYTVQILSAFIVFFLLKMKEKPQIYKYEVPIKTDFFGIISSAVSNAANAMFIICAFNIFTKVITNLITSLFSLKDFSILVLISFLDFSSAVFSLSNEPVLFNLFITGFSIGFAGISVHLQTFSVCENSPLKKGKFILFKFIQGLICGALSMLYLLFL